MGTGTIRGSKYGGKMKKVCGDRQDEGFGKSFF